MKELLMRLTKIKSHTLYLLLIIFAAAPLFYDIKKTPLPVKTSRAAESLYIALNEIPMGSTVLIESDWTISSRGESAGQLEAVLRILNTRKAKFVLYSAADAQAPLVARNVVSRINQQLVSEGKTPFKQWDDYVTLGFFPDLESMAISMSSDIRKAWAGRADSNPAEQGRQDVFKSPVLKNVKKISDCSMLINVTASGTNKILVQRIKPTQIKMANAVTGVMGVESMNYFASGQIVGLSVGLRGIVEMESMMAKGINAGPESVIVQSYKGTIPPMTGTTYDRGMKYFASLHTTMALLIIMVVLGNLGLLVGKNKSGARA